MSNNDEENAKNYERHFLSISNYLQELNIDFDFKMLRKLSKQEKRVLEEKLFKYKDLMCKQSQFKLIDNIDNEEESDYGDEEEEDQDVQQNLHSMSINRRPSNEDEYGVNSEFSKKDGPEIVVESLYSPSLRDISKPQSKKGTSNK